MATKPTESPLKQVNVPGTGKPCSKFESEWTELVENGQRFQQQRQGQLDSYFMELFCLRVDGKWLFDKIESVPTAKLLGPVKHNLALVFTSAVKIMKDVDRQDSRRTNAVQTLVPVLKSVLNRSFDNYNYDVVTLLTGNIDKSDSIFMDLVSSIDLILQSEDYTMHLRHRTLQLAIVIVASVNQGSLSSYFLRRDLFGTLGNFIADEDSRRYAFEGTLLLGLLSNYRKFETRNPYLVRMEDLVDDNVMLSMIDAVAASASNCRDRYTQLTADDAAPSFVASLSSLVLSISITDLWRQGFALPPPPASRKGKEKEIDSNAPSEDGRSESGKSQTSRPGPLRSATETSKEFAKLPTELIVVLLPFHDMLNSNKAFGSLLFSDGSDGYLPSTLISLSSYVFTHATTSSRAKLYARFCLSCLDLLLQEADKKFITESDDVRICRQRQPMMPSASGNRPLIVAMLEACVIYLRYNIQKKLEVDSYIAALKILRRVMEVLKVNDASPQYDWTIVWRTLTTLSTFIVTRHSDIAHPRLEELAIQVLLTFAYAVYWSRSFLPSIDAHISMYYEILHSEPALSGLAHIVGLETGNDDDDDNDEQASGTKTPSSPSQQLKSNGVTASPRSPRLAHYYQFASTNGNTNKSSLASSTARSPYVRSLSSREVAADSWNILHTIISFFSSKIEDARQARCSSQSRRSSAPGLVPENQNGLARKDGTPAGTKDVDELEVEDVLAILGAHVGGPDLIDSAAMADVERYDERSNETFMKHLMSTVCDDVLRLVPVKSLP